VPKTDESHQFKKNTNEVGGLGKPLGKPQHPSGPNRPWPPRLRAGEILGGGAWHAVRRRGSAPFPIVRRHGLDLIIVPVNIRQSYSILAGVGMVFRWFFDTDSFPGGGDAGVIVTLTTSVIDVIADKQIL